MNETQREQIRNNARYLRQVRPIDPEEIATYVEGHPHPAAVRRVLRESATELGLSERSDGRFEPAPTGPVSLEPTVERLPERYARRLEELLVDRFGPGWPDGKSGDRLRERIRAFKRAYLRGEAVTYDELTALGYAVYHLPAYFAATQHALAELTAEDLLGGRLRVLDVGAGVGGPALGLAAALPEDALVEYHAVEPSPAADVLAALLEETGRNVHPTIHRERIQAHEPAGPFDLVLCANVLGELLEPVEVVCELLGALAADGTLLALSPADRRTAVELRETERAVLERTDAGVYAPTVRLWPDAEPAGECWSFTRQEPIETPGFQRRLDQGRRVDSGNEGEPGDGEFVNADVQYAYSALRTDGRTAISVTPGEGTARMAETDEHVTDRADFLAVKLSHDLAEAGNPLYLIGDGSERTDHFAVLVKQTGLNRALGTAEYGDVLAIENGLVLWNDDEEAYNLVVDGETIVDRVPG
ncbi:SAM-dependent methyltransferase [Halobacteriales archaeon QH_10_67_13]|nr:MAG: SAM-dependent methyltransferase [Halobacteriales archaeon QH_10_67_13]